MLSTAVFMAALAALGWNAGAWLVWWTGRRRDAFGREIGLVLAP